MAAKYSTGRVSIPALGLLITLKQKREANETQINIGKVFMQRKSSNVNKAKTPLFPGGPPSIFLHV